MRSRPCRLCAVCGATLLALAGCYSYPYGYGGYPTYSVPAGPTYPPSGPTYPGGPFMAPGTPVTPGAPGTFAPGTTFPTPADPNWRSTPQTFPTPIGPSSDAPPYSPNGGATIPAENPVPRYGDPASPDFNQTPFGSGSTQGTGREAFGKSGSGVRLKGVEDSAAFQVDVRPASAPNSALARTTVHRGLTETSAFTNDGPAFAYDTSAYRWLRGKVDYDERERSWNIIYNLAPDETDLYQGSLSLAEGPALSQLQNDAYVLLEGRPDPQTRDARGKPCYRVDKVSGPFRPRG